MNLGDGLLFELENGKPKLILLSHGAEKNPTKQLSLRPRAANILSSRQPSYVEELQGGERPARQHAGRHRETKSKAGGAPASFPSNNTTTTTTTAPSTGGRSTTLTSSKTQEHHKGGGVKTGAKVKSDKHRHSSTLGSLRANGKTGPPHNNGTHGGGKGGLKDPPAVGEADVKQSVVCLTTEQLQQILHTVQTSSSGQHPQQGRTAQESKPDTSVNGELQEEDRGGGADPTGGSQDKDNRLSSCPFSWLEERQSHSRAAIDAKKAQWRRELDEQVALKQQQQQQQQRSAPGRLQAEEDRGSVLSVQSSTSYRDQPAAIRSSLRLGEVTPMEEVLCDERKEEQRRRWLEELDQQREETTERRRREKLLQSQTEDHELWATHFDSLQRRPPLQTAAPSAPSAPPPALPCGSERGEWEPSSSLSLVWEATSSCGAESVARASIDTTNGYTSRASHLRTMTALLDPAQIEERERRRLKQLEQQRAIEAQVEERRQQREREEARRREEEEEEERRVTREREVLERQYELDTLRERQKTSQQAEEEPKKGNDDEDRKQQETQEPNAVNQSQSESVEEVRSSTSPYRDTAVQTEAAPCLQLTSDRVHTPDVSAQYQPPPSLSAAPPNSRSRALRTGKENICLPGGGRGGDPYEPFARTDRSRRDKRRPEWNTQRPSRRFVPASERYPAALQRNRQESRQKRQAELLALQERTCLSRTDPPPPPPPPLQHQELRLCSNPTQTRTSPSRRVESVSRGAVSTERGRSPPVPAARHRAQAQQAPPSSTPPPPPPVLEFIPYVRTDEVFNLDPLEPADTPPPLTHTAPPQSSASPPAASHGLLQPELLRNTQTNRQQEILRGLAQLRQGLLQKQRELETDLNPLLKRHEHERRPPSAAHRM